MRRMIVGLVVWLIAGGVCWGAMSRQEVSQAVAEANATFRAANSTLDGEQQAGLYEQAALQYEKIIEESGIENAGLYYNLGNAYLLGGEVGRAILNYRRALRLDPGDEAVRKNLAFARGRRTDQVQMQASRRILSRLFFWHYSSSLRQRYLWSVSLVGLSCLAGCFAVWFRSVRGTAVKTAAAAAVVAAGLGMSVTIDLLEHANQQEGVIVAGEVTARQGDGLSYAPSFEAPLHEGTEFEVIQRRAGWLHIELPDGQRGWIRSDSAEMI